MGLKEEGEGNPNKEKKREGGNGRGKEGNQSSFLSGGKVD